MTFTNFLLPLSRHIVAEVICYNALITMYHSYCHSPSALTEYLKQKLRHQQAKHLGRSPSAQVEQSIPLEHNTKKPQDFDSFLWPFLQELLCLACGICSFDALSGSLFTLCAHLIVVFGDIPAISMVMQMKGHNSVSPCHMCKIQGL